MSVGAAQGIHNLSVPTPFAVGAVNVLLLEGDPLTLIDTGPNIATSLAQLQRLVEGTGHRLEDIELLVGTHQHVDHLGLTQLVAERADADVAFLEAGIDIVENFEARQIADDEYAEELMLRHGIDSHVVDALRAVASLVRGFGAPVRVTRPLPTDSVVRMGGNDFRVLHRPGHSPTDTVFHDEVNGVLLCGDHLLSEISSNALATRPLDPRWDGGRTHPLLDYRRSLLATRELDAEIVLGGHGPPIEDHVALIDERIGKQDRRAERILALIRERPRSAHDIAEAIWGRVAFTQAYLTLCEVLGHVDLLIADGAAIEEDDGTVVTFRAA